MVKVKINDRVYTVGKKNDKFLVDQEELEVDLYKRNETNFHIIHRHQSINVEVLSFDPQQKEIEISMKGKIFRAEIFNDQDPLVEKMKAATGNSAFHQKLISPMPGLVQKIFVNEGDRVSIGDSLVVLNAMKMENVLKSPVDGKIVRIAIDEGEQVEKGKVLIQF